MALDPYFVESSSLNQPKPTRADRGNCTICGAPYGAHEIDGAVSGLAGMRGHAICAVGRDGPPHLEGVFHWYTIEPIWHPDR